MSLHLVFLIVGAVLVLAALISDEKGIRVRLFLGLVGTACLVLGLLIRPIEVRAATPPRNASGAGVTQIAVAQTLSEVWGDPDAVVLCCIGQKGGCTSMTERRCWPEIDRMRRGR